MNDFFLSGGARMLLSGHILYLRDRRHRRNRSDWTAGGNIKGRWGVIDVDKGHRAMLAGFADAIRNDTPSPCDEMAGYRSLLLAELAVQSIRLGQSIPVPVKDWEPVFS